MEATRSQRLVAALEEQFQTCHGLLTGALAHVSRQGGFESLQVRTLVGLMRTTTLLATAINRLDGKPESKNLENGGSIQQ